MREKVSILTGILAGILIGSSVSILIYIGENNTNSNIYELVLCSMPNGLVGAYIGYRYL